MPGSRYGMVKRHEDPMLDHSRIRALLEECRFGHSLPQPFYRDPELYEFDLEAIHARSWIQAGLETEVPEPGSTLAFSVGRSPVVIVRGRDGKLRGFHNTCRHRGAQICENGRSRRPRLVCPYHQWAYDLEGRLINANCMGEDFDPARHGLCPVHVETVAGSVYVCIADDPPNFSPFRAAVAPLLAPHALGDAKLAHESTLVERANWKLVMENARECYHCTARHPELCIAFPVKGWRGAEYAEPEKAARFAVRMAAAGLPVGPVHGPWWQAERFPLNDGVTSLSINGKPVVAKKMVTAEDGDIGSMRWALEPCSFAHAVGDCVFVFSAMPTAPEETVVTSKWYVRKDAVEGLDYDVEQLTELWTKTNLQDRDLAENNQRGINGRGYVPGPYSAEAESLVLRFVDWYCDKARSFLEANA
jgi:glycine betaine monooxygenase A